MALQDLVDRPERDAEIVAANELAVGATEMTGTNGKPIRRKVNDEIIQWYTPFTNFSATSVSEQ